MDQTNRMSRRQLLTSGGSWQFMARRWHSANFIRPARAEAQMRWPRDDRWSDRFCRGRTLSIRARPEVARLRRQSR